MSVSGQLDLSLSAASQHPAQGVGTRPAPGPGAALDLFTTATFACQECGALARVHVLETYRAGCALYEHFCVRCARSVPRPAPLAPQAARPSLPALIALTGVATAWLAVLADWIPGWSEHPGRGMYKAAAAVLSMLLVLTGAVLAADLLVIVGVLALDGTMAADWVGLARAPGLGWKQQWLLVVSLALVAVALAAHLRPARFAARGALRSERRAPA